MRSRIFQIIIVLVFSILLVSCNWDSKPQIVGEWLIEGGVFGQGSKIEFFPNGTVIMDIIDTDGDVQNAVIVDYSFVDKKNLELSVSMDGKSDSVTFAISQPEDDTIILKPNATGGPTSSVIAEVFGKAPLVLTSHQLPTYTPVKQPLEQAIIGGWQKSFKGSSANIIFTDDGWLFIEEYDANEPSYLKTINSSQFDFNKYDFVTDNSFQIYAVNGTPLGKKTAIRMPTQDRLLIGDDYEGYLDNAIVFSRIELPSTDSLKDVIVGTWQVEDFTFGDVSSWNFLNDGTLLIKSGDGTQSNTNAFEYKFKDNHTMILYPASDAPGITFKIYSRTNGSFYLIQMFQPDDNLWEGAFNLMTKYN